MEAQIILLIWQGSLKSTPVIDYEQKNEFFSGKSRKVFGLSSNYYHEMSARSFGNGDEFSSLKRTFIETFIVKPNSCWC